MKRADEEIAKGNIRKVSHALSVDRITLWRCVKKFQIPKQAKEKYPIYILHVSKYSTRQVGA